MRKVQIYKQEWPAYPGAEGKKIEYGIGLFHQFGVDCGEFEVGFGNFTTAIIEMPDGTVESVPVKSIKFLDKPS